MELRHLRYFVAVAEEQNVTRAAARLHVTQPALSRQVRDLEEEIGFALLERRAKSVRLTDAGRVFLNEACAVLRRADEAVRTARAVAAGGGGEIKVGYAPSLTVEILPRTLRKFQSEHRNVRVELHDLSTQEMLTRLEANTLDVALGARPSPGKSRGLSFVELAKYAISVALAPSHPLSRHKSVKRERLVTEPLIAYTRNEYPEYHEALQALFGQERAKPGVVEEHDSVTSLIAAVEAGRGVALVPSCIGCMAGPRLRVLPIVPPPPPVCVGALTKAARSNAAIEGFVLAAER